MILYSKNYLNENLFDNDGHNNLYKVSQQGTVNYSNVHCIIFSCTSFQRTRLRIPYPN